MDNKDVRLAYASAYFRSHKDQHNTFQREWKRTQYATNPTYRAKSLLRSSQRGLVFESADEETVAYVEVLRCDPCFYCGDPIDEKTMQIDHIAPISRGGEHHWKNLTAACQSCNSSKNARTDMLIWMLEQVNGSSTRLLDGQRDGGQPSLVTRTSNQD